MNRYIMVKTKSGLAPGLKTYYYVWSGDNPPDELSLLKPIGEDVSPWINYVWWSNPAPGVPAEFFAIAWLGFIRVEKPGSYRFYVTTDCGSRVWIDGELVIDAWRDQPPTTYVSKPLFLEEGYHRLKYYFYNRYAFAEAVLGWIPPDSIGEPIPKDRLYYAISDKVFFVSMPRGYTVELVSSRDKKECTARDTICFITLDFEEMPYHATIRIRDREGRVVFEASRPAVFFGGDEYEVKNIAHV